jgi:EmrB/QacA subfamily drug resistance transporter
MLRIDDRRPWWILAAMGAVIGLVLLDETVVGVALATIARDLGLSQVASHWTINAYLLVFAGFVAAGGRLGDIIGLRTLFLGGVALFGLLSLASGLAQDGGQLIAARALQGIGAAVIFPASMAMVTIVFPEQQRGLALGIYGAIGTIFLALGPLVGGFLTDTLSWRWIFWINPPIVVAVALIVLAAWSDPPRSDASRQFDLAGLLSLVVGIALLVFALMQGPDWGWSDAAVWLPLVGGIVVLAIFVMVERRAAAPMIELDLFGSATFAASNLVVFAAQFTKIAVIVFGALYLQGVLQMSAFGAGLALLTAVAPVPASAVLAGRLADRLGARLPTMGGLALSAIALLWVALATGWAGFGALAPALILWGAALPFLFVPPQRAVMNAVPAEKHGQASGINLTAQLLGGTIGMAVCSTLFASLGDYRVVFLAVAGFVLAVLLTVWLSLERAAGAPQPERAQSSAPL